MMRLHLTPEHVHLLTILLLALAAFPFETFVLVPFPLPFQPLFVHFALVRICFALPLEALLFLVFEVALHLPLPFLSDPFFTFFFLSALLFQLTRVVLDLDLPLPSLLFLVF